MIFEETTLSGAGILRLEKIHDDRGFFARSYCRREFLEIGLNPDIVQCNISFNKKKGTLRGMHFQLPPHEEAKLVRCTRGAIYDVIIDIRPDSQTFKQWISVKLTAENGKMMYVPEGFAHGFQTLTDQSEVFYQMSQFYQQKTAQGIRYDDPEFNIEWLLPVAEISDRDRSFPDFSGSSV
jgi:dTDP-4-dehydrorhamnose 3,5-epimerase